MSPRRNKPKGKSRHSENLDEREITTSSDSIEEHNDGIHTVAWLEHDQDGRRHWHNICWSKRNLRQPKVERSRNSPRY
ncbi:MAG: hypothetical protein RI992_251 [Actinomycetota bacterium]